MMNKQIKGLLYFYVTDLKFSLKVFWSILLSIAAISLVITYFIRDVENGFFNLSLTGPIYVYCAIVGFLMVKDSIPFSIKMGATRKNIYISLAIFFIGLSLFMSTIASLLQVMIHYLTDLLDMPNFNFLHLANFIDGSWMMRIVIDTSVTFFALSLLFVVGLIFYKYGVIGGGISFGIVFLIVLTGIAQGWLGDFFIKVFTHFSMTFFYQLFLIGVLLYGISWFMVRRITTVKVK